MSDRNELLKMIDCQSGMSFNPEGSGMMISQEERVHIEDTLTEGESELFEKLNQTIKRATLGLSLEEAKFLVKMYYSVQDERIRAEGQMRSIRRERVSEAITRLTGKLSEEDVEEWLATIDLPMKKYKKIVDREADIPEDKLLEFVDFLGCSLEEIAPKDNPFFLWIVNCYKKMETAIKGALGRMAKQYQVGAWCQEQCGIGPVLSAAFIANFDVRKAKTAGGFWRFAGLDPTCEWNKGQKRPYNAKLKAIVCFKLGECLVKVQNRPKGFYGRLFAQKKAAEQAKNEAGEYADLAKAEMKANKDKKNMKNTKRWKHWESGKIAPAHVHDRARRWVVSIFVSHLFDNMWRDVHQEEPPKPFAFAHPIEGTKHAHMIENPIPLGSVQGKSLRELYEVK